MLGNNMFAYCGNNPSNCVDPSGTITAICHGDDVDMISMPWQDVGPAGGYRNVKKYSSIYTKTHGLIYDQETFEFSNATFGKGTMASSGCAIIAVYNAMILLGQHICYLRFVIYRQMCTNIPAKRQGSKLETI